ncbi:FG-GAP repeat domain-containing protein [Planctomycetaceae bacterium SH139]
MSWLTLIFPARLLRLLTGMFLLCGFGLASEIRANDLAPLRYNNPGLTVDLGVGLWAWPLPWDVDGDGDFDLLISCPDKPSNGVWYFENTDGDTAVNPMPVFASAKRLSGTVHYVMPSYVNGEMRVLSPGLEYQNFTQTGLQEKTKLPLAANFYKPRWETNKGPRVRHNQWRYVDFDGDGVLDLVVAVEDWSEYGWDDAWNAAGEWMRGPLHGFVFVMINQGTNDEPQYADPLELTAGDQPLDVYGCPSPNFVDFDHDGDLDLLCGEFIDGFSYFENIGTRQEPRYAPARRVLDSTGEPLSMHLQMIVPVAFDWDRDGETDLIVGDEDGRVAFVKNTGQLGPTGVPIFEPPKYFQQQADELKCGALATPWAVDWDADGDLDLLSGNTAGTIEFFENLSGPGVEFPRWNSPVPLQVDGQTFRVLAGANGSIQGPAEAKWGYTTICAADWNHDGLPDVLFNSIWGKVLWLENVGTPREAKLLAPQPIEVQWSEETPKPAWTWWQPEGKSLVTQWRTTPVVVDWNADGLNDLVMLDQEGFLAFFQREKHDGKLHLQEPRRVFRAEGSTTPLQLNSRAAGGSGRRKLCVTDWDGDGKIDFLVNSVNANWLRQTEEAAGYWTLADEGPIVSKNIQGHTTSPCVVDFNGDGIDDFIGGAEDGRFYYLRNLRGDGQPTPAR